MTRFILVSIPTILLAIVLVSEGRRHYGSVPMMCLRRSAITDPRCPPFGRPSGRSLLDEMFEPELSGRSQIMPCWDPFYKHDWRCEGYYRMRGRSQIMPCWDPFYKHDWRCERYYRDRR